MNCAKEKVIPGFATLDKLLREIEEEQRRALHMPPKLIKIRQKIVHDSDVMDYTLSFDGNNSRGSPKYTYMNSKSYEIRHRPSSQYVSCARDTEPLNRQARNREKTSSKAYNLRSKSSNVAKQEHGHIESSAQDCMPQQKHMPIYKSRSLNELRRRHNSYGKSNVRDTRNIHETFVFLPSDVILGDILLKSKSNSIPDLI